MSASDNYACPLNVEVERKALEKLNINEAETTKTLSWMSSVLGQEFPLSTFAVAIQDGELLCNLVNAIQPNTVKKIHSNIARNDEGKLKPMSMSKARENVTSFMHGAKALGVPQSSIFDTLDVVDMKNMDIIIQCIGMLGRKTGGLYASEEDSTSIQSKLAGAKQGGDAVPSIFAGRGTGNTKAAPVASEYFPPSVATKTPEEMHPGARGGGYGLDAALADKAAEKLGNMAEERDAIEGWMQAVLGVQVDVATGLRDGQILCAFVNAMWPDAIGKVNPVTLNENGEFSAPAKFKAQENVTAFIKACQAVGATFTFDTLDVVESKDLSGVLQCLSALGRVSANRTDYAGPQLYAASDSSSAAQKLQAVQQASGEPMPSIFATRGNSHATQSPVMGGTNAAAAVSNLATKTPDEMHPGARGGGYGLDAALADRAAEKLGNMAEERAAIEGWMQAVLGVNVDVFTSLRDGQILCAFVDTMWPSTIGKVNPVTLSENGEFSAPAKFKAQENVTAFIKACQAVGVPQSCTFDTLDVVESKDLNGVLQCLSALGRVSANRTDYAGPQLYAANDGSTAAQKLQAAQQGTGAKPAPTIFRN